MIVHCMLINRIYGFWSNDTLAFKLAFDKIIHTERGEDTRGKELWKYIERKVIIILSNTKIYLNESD